MIKKINLVLVALFCLAIENVFAKNIAGLQESSGHVIVLRILLIYLVFLAIYGKRNFAIGVAAAFGLLFDVVNPEIMGVYFVLIPTIVYLATKIMFFLPEHLVMVSFTAILAVIFLEVASYLSFHLIGVTEMTLRSFFEDRIPYTTLLNSGIILFLSYPFATVCSKWSNSDV